MLGHYLWVCTEAGCDWACEAIESDHTKPHLDAHIPHKDCKDKDHPHHKIKQAISKPGHIPTDDELHFKVVVHRGT